MRNSFTFDGTTSSTYSVYVSGYDTFKSPKKVYHAINIPNRNGALLTTDKRMENVSITYHCGIKDNFDTNFSNFRNFLMSRDGYCRLSDTYHASEFRKAYFEGPLEPEITPLYDAGEFDVTFNCMPQRWLTSGETVTTTTTTASWNIYNPTLFNSQPLIRVYGHGTLYIERLFDSKPDQTIVISDYSAEGVSYVDIDCELMDCYNGVKNLNKYVSLATGTDKFTELFSGTTTIHCSANITKYELTPRWWKV